MGKNFSKRYILDANVLLYDPESIYAYPDGEVLIPIFVLEEIDNFKKDINEIGRNARIVVNSLDEIRKKGALTKGVELENGSFIRVFITDSRTNRLPPFLNPHKSSNKVLAAALNIEELFPHNTYLVSNDINLRIRGAAVGLKVVPYEEKHPDLSLIYEGLSCKEIDEEEIQKIRTDGFCEVENPYYYANQVVVLKSKTSDDKLVTRFHDKQGTLVPIQMFEEGIWNVKPKNLEQAVALDVLMDPTVDVVMLAGKAGTGKTLLALAAGMEQMLAKNQYEKLLVSRPIFPMGNDLGYLPGDIEEKMEPWMQPIFDNLEFLLSSQTSAKNKISSYQRLLDQGFIELEPLTYIRGRSIPNRFIIVDEAQNLTPHEIKTIITRVGEGTKLVLTGDPYQIDNPYVDTNSNGLSHVIEKFQKYSIAGHVYLLYGVRSKLAELASDIL